MKTAKNTVSTATIASNAVIAKLIKPSKPLITFVNNLLSYEHSNSGFGSLSWDGKSSFFNVANHTFPAGFADVVQEELQKAGYNVIHARKPKAEPLGPYDPIVDEFGNDDPRYDFQLKALRQVEKYGNGIIRAATGGGKSKIAKLIMARYRRMTLFITTRGILLYQMKDQLEEIGMKSGQIGDGEMNFVNGVNLGMVQTLIQALEEPDFKAERRAVIKSHYLSKTKSGKIADEEIDRLAQIAFDRKTRRKKAIEKFLSMVEVVIGEEAHEAGGESYFQILQYCKNASIRVALTATPFMRSSAVDNMRLMAAFGRILIDVSEEELINRGILAKPYFQFKDIEAPVKLYRSTPYERAYKLGYIENTNMHDEVVADALKAKKYRLPVLALIARKRHGEILLERYREAGLKFEFLQGEDKMEERRATLSKLSKGELDGVIGTTILDVGVDVPAVGLVQRVGGMKAEVQLRQQIGRGLRGKKHMPNYAFFIDYSSNIPDVLRDHARQRELIVSNTKGFAEGIVKELPWELFDENLKQAA